MRGIHRIAIIGNGPSGVSVFLELVQLLDSRKKNNRISVTLIEKSQEQGPGMPYSTKLNGHIINMAVSTMSLKSDQVDHFYKWLLSNPEKWRHEYNMTSLAGDDTVPRRLFGIYVNHMYRDARELADNIGIAVETIKSEATSLSESKSGVRVRVDNKEREFDQVFVCAGNTSPSFGQELCGIPGYFHDPWPEELIMQGVPNDEPVVILGSGLTAIDAMITLQENGHRAPITMVSRGGLLPKVRNKAKAYDLVYLRPSSLQRETKNGRAPLSLGDCISLLRKEFDNANAKFGSDGGSYQAADDSHIEILKEDISRVKNGHANYFSVLKAIDRDAGFIWNAMSVEARLQFDRHYSTLWNMHCYPMPMPNGERTLKSLESGQLRVHAGFKDISYQPESGRFRLRTQLGPVEEAHETRFVINATGQSLDLASSQSRLLKGGLQSGALRPHPLGGIDVDFATGRVKTDTGGTSDRIYAVGLLTRGVHFYTNSIVENVRCAKRAAEDAVENITVSVPLTVPAAIALSELGRIATAAQPAE